MSNVIINPYNFVSAFPNTYSLDFDGVDDFLETTSTYSPLDGLATMSLSVWIKPTTGDSYYMVAHNPINTTIQQSQFMLFWGPGSLLEFSITSRSLFLRGDPASITIDTWNHILCCVDFNASPEGKMYVDGVDVTTGDNMSSLSTIPTATGVMRLGKEAQGYLSPFLGNIDEFAIWNTDQRANVADIYSASGAVNLSTLSAPPITWYRMGDSGTFNDALNWEIPSQPQVDNWSSHSFNFDGVDDVVNCGTLSSLTDNVSELSISFWFTIDDTGESRWAGKYNTNNRWISCQLNANDYIYFIVANGGLTYGGFEAISSGEVVVNTWYHIAFVFDGTFTDGDTGVQNAGRCKIYLNGVSKTLTFTGTIPATTYDFASLGSPPDWTIGIDGIAYGFADGKIDGFSIWDEALTSGNVTSIFASGVPNDVTGLGISGLQAYYRMGEDATWDGSDWTIPDDSTNSNDGTSANMAVDDKVNNAPDNINQTLSSGMVEADRETDTPP